MKDIFIIIPAYNPDETLIKLIKNLKEKYTILVINDGSEKECKYIFDEIKTNVILIEHQENLGKGASIKDGLRECLKQELSIKGVITVDADGQHCVEDIQKIKIELEKQNNVILGVRDIRKMPTRSRIGNRISQHLIQKRFKVKIQDTQTGLRGIPRRYIKQFSDIKGDRFDYETEMLKYILRNQIDFDQIVIKTIYDKNKKSTFKTIFDSFNVLNTILK